MMVNGREQSEQQLKREKRKTRREMSRYTAADGNADEEGQ